MDKKILNVMSDKTRFEIYQFIYESHKEVDVNDVADKFFIHPNVARMHLQKLESAGLIIAEFEKKDKAGRPKRFYSIAQKPVTLSFPPQDQHLFTNIVMKSLLSFGEAGKEAVVKAAYEIGKYTAQTYQIQLGKSGTFLSFDQKVKQINDLLSTMHLNSRLTVSSEKEILFQVFNCPFKEWTEDEMTCTMHNEFLKGVFEVYLGDIQWKEQQNMMSNACKSCDYHIECKK